MESAVTFTVFEK